MKFISFHVIYGGMEVNQVLVGETSHELYFSIHSVKPSRYLHPSTTIPCITLLLAEEKLIERLYCEACVYLLRVGLPHLTLRTAPIESSYFVVVQMLESFLVHIFPLKYVLLNFTKFHILNLGKT